MFDFELKKAFENAKVENMVGIIDTSFSSASIGDKIITDCCYNIIENEFYPDSFIIGHPSHSKLDGYVKYKLNQCKNIFVTGTNLLCNDVKNYKQFICDGMGKLNNPPILMGCGWHSYSAYTTEESAKLLADNLNKNKIHSVRDSYTENKLKQIGIKNVINTSCPTLWGVEEQHTGIKKKSVVLTFHYGHPNRERDLEIINFAKLNYNKYYVWPQGYLDSVYALSLGVKPENILRPKISSLVSKLCFSDYLGVRMHSSIVAMTMGCSSNVIAIDNRVTEMFGDLGIRFFNEINFKTEIAKPEERTLNLPKENIETWKGQFK